MDTSIEMILAQGARAEALLNDPTYATTVAEIKDAYTAMLFSSALGDTTKREQAYFIVRALADIDALLKARVNVKDQQIMNSEQANLF
jgi:hypothetical protein